MYLGFQNDFPNGLGLTQFTDLFPDLNNGVATANLVFRFSLAFFLSFILIMMMIMIRVLDDDGSGQLGYKEFLQAIDLVGARTPDDKLRWAFNS